MSIRLDPEPSPRPRRVKRWIIFVLIPFLAVAIATAAVQFLVNEGGSAVKEAIGNQPPIRVDVASGGITVDVNVENLPKFVIPRPLSEIPPPPGQDVDSAQRYKWANRLGGVDAGRTSVDIIIQGRSSKVILIKGIRVIVRERRAPLSGTHITYGPIGEHIPVRSAYVDLDRPSKVELFDEDDTPLSFPLAVSEDKVEVVRLSVFANSCDCTWTAEVLYLDGGKERTYPIKRQGGQPFRTTAPSRAKSYYSNDGRTFHPDVQQGP